LTRRILIAQSISSVENDLYAESISFGYRSLVEMSL
jgi:hypothetical protein